MDKTLTKTVSRIVNIALKVLVVVSLVNFLGINTSGFTALIASFGVGIGLAVNGAAGNFAGGLLILVSRPFKLDDYIEIGGSGGTVEDIRLIHTKIRTPDNKVVYVPNGTASTATIVNYSEKPVRRLDQTFSIDRSSDFTKAKEIVLRLASEHKAVLKDPAPLVKLSGGTADGMDIVSRLWVNREDYWDVYYDMAENVRRELDAAGMEIPLQQVEIRMKQQS